MDHVWLATALTAVTLRGLAWPISPTDFWWQAALGRWIVEHGQLPTSDTFAWTIDDAPFFDQPWLSQVALYALWKVGSASGCLLAVAALLLLTQGQLLLHAIRRSAHVQAASVLVLLSMPVQMTNWELRSQLLVLPLFALFLGQLDRWRLSERSTASVVAVLAPAMALWTNLHGSFPLGIVLLGLFAGSRVLASTATTRSQALKQSLVLTTATAGATVLNPHGLEVWRYVLRMVGESRIQGEITEWAAPTLSEPIGQIFYAWASVVFVLGALATWKRREVPWFDLALVSVFAALASTSARHILWFGMVVIPVATGWLATLWVLPEDDDRDGSRVLNAMVMSVFGLMVIGMLPPVKAGLPLPDDLRMPLDRNTPVAAVFAIQELPRQPKRLFHSEQSGSYLMYAAPGIPVFIDARIELYPAELVEDFRSLSRAEKVDELCAEYDFDGMLLDLERFAPLATWLDASPSWTRAYADTRFAYWEPRMVTDEEEPVPN